MEANELMDAVAPLRFIHLQVALRARERLQLPPFQGTMLRGAFGRALQRVACSTRTCHLTGQCQQRSDCIYAYLFETPGHEDAPVLRHNSHVPHPFVLQPPWPNRRRYERGECMKFGLVLIGRGVQYLPLVVVALETMAHFGLGKGRSRCYLESVSTLDGNGRASLVFDGRSGRFVAEPRPLSVKDLAQPDVTAAQVGLRFLTPLRLREQGQLCAELTFVRMARALVRRVSALLVFHHQQELRLDAPTWMQAAAAVPVERHELRWREWERYSTRQQERLKLGGLAGEVWFGEQWALFWPLLRLGEALHVGKGTAFGLGRYQLVTNHQPDSTSCG